MAVSLWGMMPFEPFIKRRPFANARRTSELYGTARWKRERAAFLRANSSCACSAPAAVVDHEPPHRGDEAAFFDRSRYRAVCWPCSNRKTGRETRERVRIV